MATWLAFRLPGNEDEDEDGKDDESGADDDDDDDDDDDEAVAFLRFRADAFIAFAFEVVLLGVILGISVLEKTTILFGFKK